MSTVVPSTLPSSAPINGATITNAVERRSAAFHPSVWGDHFLSYESRYVNADGATMKRIETLKEEVKRMLVDADKLQDKLNLIDQIQRLGFEHLFEKEIDESLATIWKCGDYDDDDLHITALMFRLLRQQGYRISCDVFHKFKDSRGKFSSSLVRDVRGLVSLYEASHLNVHGEDILEEARTFTVHHLKSALGNNHDPKLISTTLVTEVQRALELPLCKGLIRLDAWRYIQTYGDDASHNKALLELAKLDFNWLQEQHQKELCEITRWWKDGLDVERNYPYARDRVTEVYFWILGVYFEPEFSQARVMLSKVMALVSVLDDTYDVYGTPEELQLLTDAIDKWDIFAMDGLPKYMHIFYKAMLDTYSEFEEKLAEKGTTYRLFYAKEAMKNLARVFFKEAAWFHENYIPTLEEYVPLALETCGFGMLVTSSLLGMGDVISKDAFEWLENKPKILQAAKVVCRFTDDIVSHKHEQERGHVASAVEVYMEQHGVTEQEAERELRKMIDDAWKDINKECLRPTPAPVPILMRILNLTRGLEVLYKDRDGYTNSQTKTKGYVAALLVNPFPV